MNGLDVVDEGGYLGARFRLLAGGALVLVGPFARLHLLGAEIGERGRFVFVVALAAHFQLLASCRGRPRNSGVSFYHRSSELVATLNDGVLLLGHAVLALLLLELRPRDLAVALRAGARRRRRRARRRGGSGGGRREGLVRLLAGPVVRVLLLVLDDDLALEQRRRRERHSRLELQTDKGSVR